MKFRLLLLLLLTFSITKVNAQKDFPKYHEIVNRFFKKYDLKGNQDSQSIRFVKQTDGYYVEEYDYSSQKYGQKQLFWSAKKGKYSKLSFPKGRYEEQEVVGKILRAFNANKFDLYPVYGYVNWEKDVVAYFQKMRDLSDDELYAFGRAYSNIATNLINNNTGFADESQQFQFKEQGRNQFSAEQLKTYREYRHKAIEKFGELVKRNPDYKTIVGSIGTKYHNEFLTGFLDLRVYHNELEASKELPDSIYSPFYLDMARNYLNSCDSNAVLFTNGDNDTYSLLYVQAKHGFRQDVLVVNLSLLNNNNYINHLKVGGILKAKPVAGILSPQSYAGDKLAYAMLMKSDVDEETENLQKTLTLIEETGTVKDNNGYAGSPCIISDKHNVVIDSENIIPLKVDNNYILKGDLMAFDIIQSNIANRPVYFLFRTSFNIEDNLELHGFAYKLVANTNVVNDDILFGGIDAKKTYDRLMYNFNYTVKSEKKYRSEKIVMNAYQRSFCHLARYYADKSEIDSCRKVIKRYLELFPNPVYEMDHFLIPMLKAAYIVDLAEEADFITLAIVENLMKKSNAKDLSDYEERTIKYTVYQLKEMTSTKDKELVDKLVLLAKKFKI